MVRKRIDWELEGIDKLFEAREQEAREKKQKFWKDFAQGFAGAWLFFFGIFFLCIQIFICAALGFSSIFVIYLFNSQLGMMYAVFCSYVVAISLFMIIPQYYLIYFKKSMELLSK